MNPFKQIGKAFKTVGVTIGKWASAFWDILQARGVDDAAIEHAIALATRAQMDYPTNEERREYVIAALMAGGMKESVARTLVEIAVQILKSRREQTA